MPAANQQVDPQSRRFKLAGLLCVLVGFALELVGVVNNSWTLFKFGLFLFLMSVPCYLIGRLLGRRKPLP